MSKKQFLFKKLSFKLEFKIKNKLDFLEFIKQELYNSITIKKKTNLFIIYISNFYITLSIDFFI